MSLDLLNTALMMRPLNWFYHRSLSGTTGGIETIDVIPILNNCFPPIAPNYQKILNNHVAPFYETRSVIATTTNHGKNTSRSHSKPTIR